MNRSGFAALAFLAIIVLILLVWTLIDGPGVKLTWADPNHPPFDLTVNICPTPVSTP